MSEIKPIDPRVKRLDLQPAKDVMLGEHELGPTYEVFHQKKRGAQPIHVGIIHAPNPQMALLLAKEQYGRRNQTANIWVVKTSDVYIFNYEDEDIFETTPEKVYRAPETYKVKEKIEAFKRLNH